MVQSEYIDHILKNLPHGPGVYKMKNKEGEIIYVGKAKNLKNRVSSYFQNRNDKAVRTLKMVEQIQDIEYMEVGSELEALILETNFIKELRPKYNILMKDDKNYVYIKITVNEPFPRIFIVRKVSKDKARYFGPKTAAHKVLKTLKVLKKIFPFRHCQLQIDYVEPSEDAKDTQIRPSDINQAGTDLKQRVKVTYANIKYPCLDYHIKRCVGPCIGKVTPEEYRKIIEQVIRFLEGKHEEISDKLKEEMLQAAAQKKFELAAAIRDKLQAVEEISERQRISDPHQKDLDIIQYVFQDSKIYFNLFQLRNGKLTGQENFILNSNEEEQTENPDVLTAFLEQYYEKATDLPQEILVPHAIEDPEVLEDWLKEMKGQKVTLVVPERGKKNRLLDLSLANAKSFAQQSMVKWQGEEYNNRQKALAELQKILNLPEVPVRLECFDNSHFGGTETVSSMVVFENGFPKKSDYRHFKLHQQTSGAPDDFASMEETLTRRLKYLKPTFLAHDLKILKAKKKDTAFLLKQLAVEDLPKADFWMIEKEKEIIGFLQVLPFPNKKTLIQKVELLKEVDLHSLLKKILEKTKVKRLYFILTDKEVSRFEEVGLQEVNKIPPEFTVPDKQRVFVYDSIKYAVDGSFKKVPHLLIIDGGKGQLSSAQKALRKFNLDIPMISLAKREEEIFAPGREQSIQLEKNDPILHMIQHIRDEAHRFAITYHQNLRLKATTRSRLDEISGIGPELKKKLLQKFGSVEGIMKASVQEVGDLIGEKNAEKLRMGLGTVGTENEQMNK